MAEASIPRDETAVPPSVHAVNPPEQPTVAQFLGRPPGPYTPGSSFKYWLMIFETYLKIRQVTDEALKVQLLICEIGGVAYEALEGLLRGERADSRSYADLVSILTNHYTPKLLTLGERFKLLSLVQKEGQSLADFYGALAHAARTCEFKSVKEVEDCMITMAFLKGLRNESTRVRLLEKEGSRSAELLSSAQAFEVAQGHGLATALQPVGVTVKAVKTKTESRAVTCFVCGKHGHVARKCPERKMSKKTHMVNVCDSDDDESTYRNTYKVMTSSLQVVSPYVKEILVEGMGIPFEIDTGSPCTVITEQTWKKLNRPPLRAARDKLRGYTGEEIPVLGTCDVTVQLGRRKTVMQVQVAKKSSINVPQLCGRDMIHGLGLDGGLFGRLRDSCKKNKGRSKKRSGKEVCSQVKTSSQLRC